MIIQNSLPWDLDKILSLYETARRLQKEKGAVLWPEFDKTLIASEILEKRQWKILIENQVACVWATTFEDPQIWGEQNEDPSVYIHRIATEPSFRGMNLVAEIVAWAKGYAASNGKRFVRLDTVGENKGLIAYYKKSGFQFLGLRELKDTEGLPKHYHGATVSLFQIKLQ